MMNLREKMEFSKEALDEFDYLEKIFPGAEEIGFGCNGRNSIEIFFMQSAPNDELYKTLEQLDNTKIHLNNLSTILQTTLSKSDYQVEKYISLIKEFPANIEVE